MTDTSLEFLGPVRVERGNTQAELRRSKARAVLALLAAGERSPTRDTLMALLWPQASQKRAAGSLRTVLSDLRKALPQGALEVTPSGRVCLHLPEGATDLDRLAALEQAFENDAFELDAADAVLLGSGAFCEGLVTRDTPEFEDWLGIQRQQLAQRVRSLRRKLWRAQVDRDRLGPALRTATMMCAADPLDETGQRCLIETHLLHGDDAAARRAYEGFVEAFEREFGHPVSEQTRALLSGAATAQSDPEAKRRLSVVLSADVVGYAKHMARDEDATVRTISELRATVDRLVPAHRGRCVDFTGDNFLAEFPTALDCLRGALALQTTASEGEAAREVGLRLRMGVHLGEVRVEGRRLFGDTVNIAARLQQAADPGCICVSRSVLELVEGKLDLQVDDLGTPPLKNIAQPVHVYRVRGPLADGEGAAGKGVLRTRVRRSASTDLPKGTVAFLLADVARSLALWRQDADAMAEAIDRYYALLDAAVAAHGGVLPEEQGEGDGVVAVFRRPSDALAAACDAQRALHSEAWPTASPLRVRMAVHSGEARLRDERSYTGVATLIAAQLRDIAHGGQVLVSAVAHRLACDDLDGGVTLLDLGDHRLQDAVDRERVYQLTHPELPADFEPLPSRHTPTNLPAQLDAFIGRDAELAVLAELLACERLVTIAGTGGAGKTRLALASAAGLGDRFPDGVWWLELAPLGDGSKVAQALADVLGARIVDGVSPADAVVRRLAGDRALVVLDNCEHLLGAASELAARVLRDCPHSSLLATSRGALDLPGEHVWRAPPLSLPQDASAAEGSDAVRLFVDRAKRVRPDFDLVPENRATVVEICRRLEGIPLAIELAAARTRALTAEQILDGLSDALGLLTRGARTSLPHHQTLEASIAWSVALLDDAERAVLDRLSVFSGSFDLAAVQALCDETPAGSTAVLDALERLLDLSLVSPTPGPGARLSQLETVRQFGHRHLEAAGDAAALQERHARYFAELATIGPLAETAEELAVTERLGAEQDNLRAALAWHRDQGEVGALAAMVDDLAPYWNLSGAMAESLHWTTCALDALSDEPSVRRARLLAHRALVQSNLGAYAGSIADCEAALRDGEKVDDAWSVGRARWVMADFGVYDELKRWRPLSQRSVDALTASGDRFALAYARIWQAVPLLIRGHRHEGVAALEAAAGPVAEVGNPTLLASHRAWQGWAALYGGDLDQAERLATQLLAGAEFQLATQRFFGEWLLAATARYRGVDHPLLAQLAARAESARRRGEGLAAMMYQYYHSSCLLFADPTAALDAAEDLIARYTPSHIVAGSHQFAAWASLALGQADAAAAHLEAAESARSTMTWPINQVTQLLIRSLLRVARGEIDAAATDADAAAAIAQRVGLTLDLVHALEVRAVVAVAADDHVRAARLLGAASTRREQLGLAGAFLPLSARVADAVERARTALGADAFEAERAVPLVG